MENILKKLPKLSLYLHTHTIVAGMDELSLSRLRFLKTQSSPLVRPWSREIKEGHETLVLSL